jgi:hypothetical protein
MIKIKNIKYILIAVVLVFIISIGILGCFWNKENNISVPSISKEENEKESSNKNEIPATSSPIPAPLEVWKTYVSAELGFSIRYPEMVYRAYRCGSKKPFYVPLRVFEDKESGIVYITKEYYYKGKYNSELNKYTGPCEKIMNSLELLQKEKEEMQKGEFSLWWKPFLGWAVSTGNIKNEDELNKFIKDNYSSGCFAESKNFWQQQAGVYEIKLNRFKDAEGNNTDLGNAVCPVNYVYKILYIPEKNKVMSVKLGQECSFITNLTENYKCYDDEMINSFKFE